MSENNETEELFQLIDKIVARKQVQADFIPGKTYIPASGKIIGAPEIKLMVEASIEGWLTSGRLNEQFEKRLAQFIGVKNLITVNSGSSANLVAFSTLTSPALGDRRILPGDEVISVAAAFPTTVNPIMQAGAIPVFVDVDIPGYNVNIDRMISALSPKTKAVFIAHTLGNPFNVKAVAEFCKQNGLWLIEDCCDALGAEHDGKKVGTIGDLGTLSFYPAHHITMGEGGAVFTNNPKLKKITESYRDWGRDCWCLSGQDDTCGKRFNWQLGNLPQGYDHKYIYSHMGYNLKITEMQAACGLAQLDRLQGFIDSRRSNFEHLTERLKRYNQFFILPQATPNSNPSWFGFPMTIRNNVPLKRLPLLKFLESRQIGSRLLFAGNITKQPYMQGANYRISGSLENTDTIMERTFWLGIYPGLTREMLDYVSDTIGDYLATIG